MTLTHARLTELLHYAPNTGVFCWKVAANNRVKPGVAAGTINHDGYVRITISKRQYMAHRLAWFYVTGEWVVGELDHINGDRRDNRIENIRIASRTDNCRNRKLSRSSTSGFKGVSFYKAYGKWQAQIVADKKYKHIGYFDTAEEAADAYDAHALALHGSFAKTNQSLR